MVRQVNIHEAKTQLSKLLAAVEAGDEVIIANAGKPVARLSPITPVKTMKAGWAGKGGLWMSADFHETPPEFLESFDRPLP
jgi:prevent-host-death family protein